MCTKDQIRKGSFFETNKPTVNKMVPTIVHNETGARFDEISTASNYSRKSFEISVKCETGLLSLQWGNLMIQGNTFETDMDLCSIKIINKMSSSCNGKTNCTYNFYDDAIKVATNKYYCDISDLKLLNYRAEVGAYCLAIVYMLYMCCVHIYVDLYVYIDINRYVYSYIHNVYFFFFRHVSYFFFLLPPPFCVFPKKKKIKKMFCNKLSLPNNNKGTTVQQDTFVTAGNCTTDKELVTLICLAVLVAFLSFVVATIFGKNLETPTTAAKSSSFHPKLEPNRLCMFLKKKKKLIIIIKNIHNFFRKQTFLKKLFEYTKRVQTTEPQQEIQIPTVDNMGDGSNELYPGRVHLSPFQLNVTGSGEPDVLPSQRIATDVRALPLMNLHGPTNSPQTAQQLLTLPSGDSLVAPHFLGEQSNSPPNQLYGVRAMDRQQQQPIGLYSNKQKKLINLIN
ncbi:hypothetical protein RFI_26502 [Reticulomyxa filosa]|uniref:Uncharacterized protein n=1 Tax=Reticulomyxa filosa TaxID=46433 RepID=X6MAL3_RETFI|nr:hypothetical protein RFI_26502 [Reticulomyxa filosa]|eukprot:ETO10874.1 hypothetical protein RFI_26502 [Reticulomyxa filosa]